jgi:hypothetical protein
MDKKILTTIQKFNNDLQLRRLNEKEVIEFLIKYGWKSDISNIMWTPPVIETDEINTQLQFSISNAINMIVNNPEKYIKEPVIPKKDINLIPGLKNLLNFMMRKK